MCRATLPCLNRYAAYVDWLETGPTGNITLPAWRESRDSGRWSTAPPEPDPPALPPCLGQPASCLRVARRMARRAKARERAEAKRAARAGARAGAGAGDGASRVPATGMSEFAQDWADGLGGWPEEPSGAAPVAQQAPSAQDTSDPLLAQQTAFEAEAARLAAEDAAQQTAQQAAQQAASQQAVLVAARAAALESARAAALVAARAPALQAAQDAALQGTRQLPPPPLRKTPPPMQPKSSPPVQRTAPPPPKTSSGDDADTLGDKHKSSAR